MISFGRGKAAEAAQDIADHLKLVDNVKALQTAQKELARTVERLAQEIASLRADLKVARAEIKLDCVKEVHETIDRFKDQVNKNITEITMSIALSQPKSQQSSPAIPFTPNSSSSSSQGPTQADA